MTFTTLIPYLALADQHGLPNGRTPLVSVITVL